MMTLEEAIKHCKDTALSCTNKECALEHFQLLKWLQEYSNMLEKQGKQKPTDKNEPKFKVGDWMVYEENIYQIHNISLKKYYECLRTDGTVHTFDFEYIDSKSHLWTIKDAKDGDVLVIGGAFYIVIFGGLSYSEDNIDRFKSYCYYYREGIFSPIENPNWCCNAFHPATKEQRDLLFQKMHEAGYEWDANKKELKKIIDKKQIKKNLQDNSFRRMFEQNPAWSEEDETKLTNTIIMLKEGASHHFMKDDIAKAVDWLKSLKERYTWKPSEEQLRELENVFSPDTASWDDNVLRKLHEQLKQL